MLTVLLLSIDSAFPPLTPVMVTLQNILPCQQESYKRSHHIRKCWISEMCLLICLPDSEWWTEWRCRVAVLRAAKRGRIPGTQWHLLRCKMLLLLSFMVLDLLFRRHKARSRGLTASRGERRRKVGETIAHKAILLKIPRNDLAATPRRDLTSFPL